jgi:hypothetical protein
MFYCLIVNRPVALWNCQNAQRVNRTAAPVLQFSLSSSSKASTRLRALANVTPTNVASMAATYNSQQGEKVQSRYQDDGILAT